MPKTKGLRPSLIFFGTAVLILIAARISGGEKQYKPIKAPVIPGVREIAERDQAKRIAPYLEGAGGDELFASDLSSEVSKGATNSAAALGNGRLSALISPWAELTALRWPSPLYGDQLRYFTLAGTAERPVRMYEDAPSPDWRRYGHPQDPCPGLGSRGGLLLDSGEVVWLGDPSWTSARSFSPEDSMTLATTLKRPDLAVYVIDFIDPERDLMVRQFKIHGSAHRFFYHGTFAPRTPDPAEGVDWDPADAGFAAVYLASDQVMIHFQPKAKKPMALDHVPASATELDAAYPGGGSFVAWGFSGPVLEFQVGADRCLRTVDDKAPLSGFDDAVSGGLSGNPLFTGLVNAAMSCELSGDESAVTVFIAVADSAEGAVDLLRQARDEGADALRTRSTARWQAAARVVHAPSAADPVTRRVITRSVLNVLAGQDREHGAIVASISRQPPYHFDYPRDGAFFDLTLDLAGFPDEVTHHHQFLKRTQYRQRFGFSPIWMLNFRSPFFDPSGNWPHKMSVDGSSPTSFLVNPCEIDETALSVWNFWRHERSLAESERAAYINEMRETFMLAADALLDWVDLRRGWTRPATEDDSFPPDATLHGASSTLTAMAAACDAGPRWGFPEDKTVSYCEAARSLRAGIRGRVIYPETLDHAGYRGLAWTLWPAPAFGDYTEPGAQEMKERLAERIRQKVSRESTGFAYLGEDLLALAMADQGRGEYRELLTQALILLTHEAAFPGTDCFGEITMWGDFEGTGKRVAQQRTAVPHLWNGVTVYLAAIAIFEPELLNKMQPPAPE